MLWPARSHLGVTDMRAYTTFERREHTRLKAIAGASVMLDERSYLMSDCSEGGLLCVDYYGPRRVGDVVEMRLIAAKEDSPQQTFRLQAEVMRYDDGQRTLAVKFRLPDDERGDRFRSFIREYMTDGAALEGGRKESRRASKEAAVRPTGSSAENLPAA